MFTKHKPLTSLVLLAFILGGCGLFDRTIEEEPTSEEPTEQVGEEPAETDDEVDEEKPVKSR